MHPHHFILVPLLAQGHIIPMLDLAKLLAHHGVIATLVTTPCNAHRLRPTINRARAAGLPVRLLELPFPSQEVGLPPACENLDTVPSRDLIRKFYAAVDSLRWPLEDHLARASPPPTCIISDKCLSWTSLTAERFRVPRLVFHGMCCFALLASHNVRLHRPHLTVQSDCEAFPIPGMPVGVDITRAQLPGAFVAMPDLDDIRDQMQAAESNAYGVVVNTFHELESGCVEEYKKAVNKKVWCIGPVSLCNREVADKFDRGNRPSIDVHKCLDWLDSKSPKSVMYACLGSQCRLIPAQLIELGLGMEDSGHPFIWVVKTGDKRFDEWLVDESFEERVGDRGLVIKGWAPQVLILSHPAIGGFLTHCGWNSTIEGVCSGVPMATWPMFAEQFLNEKLIVEILGIGVRVGVEFPVRWGEEERVGVLVVREQVVAAVVALMEGERRRDRAAELRVNAMKKMEKGGCVGLNISAMIGDVVEEVSRRRAESLSWLNVVD